MGTSAPAFRLLVALLHLRWTVPILAELHNRAGGRFVVLVNALGMSRDSLRQTLTAMIKHRWVTRNPGYGHPLRPEYVLTAAGRRLGPWCCRLLAAVRAGDWEELALRKWTLPVLLVVGRGRSRFGEIKSEAAGITSRALALCLKDLTAAGLIERSVADSFPPSARYAPTPAAEPLLAVLREK